MAEKRKARAQSLNDATFDGVSEPGNGRDTDLTVPPGCDGDADAFC
jgi:hypothetical protein